MGAWLATADGTLTTEDEADAKAHREERQKMAKATLGLVRRKRRPEPSPKHSDHAEFSAEESEMLRQMNLEGFEALLSQDVLREMTKGGASNQAMPSRGQRGRAARVVSPAAELDGHAAVIVPVNATALKKANEFEDYDLEFSQLETGVDHEAIARGFRG